MKKISIIIATYNASETLRNCLDSVVPQLTDECELIIIDGGSKDNTNDIIRSYGDKIAYTVSEKDKGVYDAWNKGIKIAEGGWIMFIGADDVLLPDAIEKYLKVLGNTPTIDSCDYISAHDEFIDNEGTILKINGRPTVWAEFRKRMTMAHVASLHNAKLFEEVGLFDFEHYHICADYELLIRKRDKLRTYFIDTHIARMKAGGMSFSTKAIIETFHIRKQHHSISALLNYMLFIRDYLGFQFFVLRKRMRGRKL